MDRIISTSEIGRKIKSYRQKAGLTQEKLAEILGVTVQQVQNYESGRTTLNVDNLQKICSALNASPVDIFVDSSSDLYYLSQDEKSVLGKFRLIKDSDKINCIRTLLDALATSSK